MRLPARLGGLALAALPLAGPALACEYLTEHFELCLEGSPWAGGRWENGGDSATLYIRDERYAPELSFEGFEDYYGKDRRKALSGDLAAVTEATGSDETRVEMDRDRFRTADLKVVRVVNMTSFAGDAPHLVVEMIAAAKGERIFILMNGPSDVPVPEMKAISQDMAARIHPRGQS